MAFVKLTTLTPVHIGSGRIFKHNIDCLDFPKENSWGIVDEHKVFNIIGQDSIDKWVSNIENGVSVVELVQKRKPNLTASDISLRVLKKGNKTSVPPQSPELREQLHTHNFIPLIPGSSLKGGIRTAVFRRKIEEDVLSGTLEISPTPNSDKNWKGEYTDKRIRESLLGQTPNDDPFRFIRISDFHFERTEAFIAGSFNDKKWESRKLKQWIEVIPSRSVSKGILDVGGTRFSLVRSGKVNQPGFKKIQELQSISSLFKTINFHTRTMLEREIAWAERKDGFDAEECADYLFEIKSILNQVENLDASQSAIFRVGYGIGLKFMTGDWQEKLMSEVVYSDWKQAQRKPQYSDFEYPKTRRMVEGGTPLGFVRLDLMPESEIPDLSILSRIHNDLSKVAEIEQAAPLSPEYFTGTLKPGVSIAAEYIGPGSNSNNKKFRLLIGDADSEALIECRYPSEIKGIYHWLKVNAVKKNKKEIESVSYDKPW